MSNINTFRGLILYLCLLLLLPMCEFKPDEIPLTNLESPSDPPPVSLKINNNTDTIKIGWKTDFYYEPDSRNKILSVKFFFEDKEVHNYQYNKYYSADGNVFFFSFDPSPYSNGNYNFLIQIITGSGTGSIADKLGAEGFLYILTWPVCIDKTLPEGPYNYKVSAVQTEKGIELLWPAFNHPNFNSYEVLRQYPFIQNNPVLIASFTNPLQNHFTDNTYWEGTSCIYFVRINTPAGGLNGEYIWFTPSLGKFEAKLNDDRTIDVSWDKARTPASFGKYYIYLEKSNNTLLLSQIIDNVNLTSAKFNPGTYNGDLYIFFKIIPANVTEPYYKYLGYKMVSLYIP